ncbi:13588_t:CDS:2 [Dentiscutata heterogama]|uniref:13588_t:CDS:1 n=1 Tax=Dentiscutata heterogama TaxID=1316150 RepID=A0ACA9MBL2_9GLOM|nr:13588_t:CDS:2 [Dentiscutata heterogama]
MGHIAYLSRKETFSAAHRLHSPYLTEEKNKELYGKCNNPNGHGHNYTGMVQKVPNLPVDPHTGMVMNITDLKKCMRVVLDELDHKNLDLDVPYFTSCPSTTEMLAVFIWDNMRKHLPKGKYELYEVKIHETENNVVIFRGELSSTEDVP